VENKVFRKIEKVFRLYFGENGAVYPNSEDLFSQLDKQFDEQKKLLKIVKDIKHATPDQLFFKPKTFIKKP
jgi:transcription-repair coupling factor (superfamily II helicase)